MAAGLFQQGSKGQMRDLDYINPRPPRSSCALPAEVRMKLGIGSKSRSSSEPPQANCIYTGAANADSKVGQSGAGTNWQNPNGHAFIRKGSGVAMSSRASGHARATGQCAQLIALQSGQDPSENVAVTAANSGSRAGSRASSRHPSRESRPGSTGARRVVKEASVPIGRRPPQLPDARRPSR